jgi:hypothetical protein
MKRWLLIAVAIVMTLGGLTLTAAPAMAREYHSRYTHEHVSGYHRTWSRNAARHRDSYRTHNVHTAHFRTRGHVGHRR